MAGKTRTAGSRSKVEAKSAKRADWKTGPKVLVKAVDLAVHDKEGTGPVSGKRLKEQIAAEFGDLKDGSVEACEKQREEVGLVYRAMVARADAAVQGIRTALDIQRGRLHDSQRRLNSAKLKAGGKVEKVEEKPKGTPSAEIEPAAAG